MAKIYLYLGRRDKSGIQVLSTFATDEELPRTRVANIKDLHLPSPMEMALSNIAYEKRMLWEVWIESADDFRALRDKLSKRGYKNLPLHADQLHPSTQYRLPGKKKIAPDTSLLGVKKETMLQRNSLASSHAALGNRKRTTPHFHN